MTDNEAILVLKRSRIQNVNDDDFEKAFEMAISALNQEKPLCKIGDTVYFIYTGLNRGVLEGKVNNINITEEGIRYYAGYCSDFDDYDIGKTVFLTEAQAEAALQKM